MSWALEYGLLPPPTPPPPPPLLTHTTVAAYIVAGDNMWQRATICVMNVDIYCRRRRYVTTGHNMCRERRHILSPATICDNGRQYMPQQQSCISWFETTILTEPTCKSFSDIMRLLGDPLLKAKLQGPYAWVQDRRATSKVTAASRGRDILQMTSAKKNEKLGA